MNMELVEAAHQDDEIVKRAGANVLENFSEFMKAKVEGLMIDLMDQNREIVTRYLDDPEFKATAVKLLVKRIHEEIRAGSHAR
jgi:hypothetical protein